MSSETSSHLETVSSNLQKYRTPNPLMRRIIHRFLDRVCELVEERRPSRIVDLGCGEGIVARELSLRLGDDFEYLGLDLSGESIEVARSINASDSRLSFERADILAREPDAGWADLAISLEVLEHLAEPAAALNRIGQWSRSHVLVSVPWEPWFRLGNLARGRHPLRLGNHPEHIQQFRPGTLAALLKGSSELDARSVEVSTCFPWMIGRGRVNGSGSDTAHGAVEG